MKARVDREGWMKGRFAFPKQGWAAQEGVHKGELVANRLTLGRAAGSQRAELQADWPPGMTRPPAPAHLSLNSGSGQSPHLERPKSNNPTEVPQGATHTRATVRILWSFFFLIGCLFWLYRVLVSA